MDLFTNLKVQLDTGEIGSIEGVFGLSGKLRIRFPAGLSESTKQYLEKQNISRKKKSKTGSDKTNGSTNNVTVDDVTESFRALRVKMEFRRYVYDPQKRMVQAD